MRTLRRATNDGPPVYGLPRTPGHPRVLARRIGVGAPTPDGPGMGPVGERHSHDFAVLLYVEAGSGELRTGATAWEVAPGDLYVVAPGAVVSRWDGTVTGLRARQLLVAPDELGLMRDGAVWSAHPLLRRVARGEGEDVLRLHVPPADRPRWPALFDALEEELRERCDGYRDAVAALLALMAVGVSRLATDVVADLRDNREPLLAEVFDVIEDGFAGALSLADVAAAVNLTPGHLTTTVRRRTGRTVQDWIVARRMAEARRLLSSTDVPVATIGRTVGFGDPGYFARVFGREHGVSPTAWRAGGGG